VIADQTLALQTIDISLGGAKLFASGAAVPVEPGCAASLILLGMRPPLPGSIRWRADGKLGFHFDTELTAGVLDCIRTNPSVQVRRAYLNGRLINV
jgi:hypothetical protein